MTFIRLINILFWLKKNSSRVVFQCLLLLVCSSRSIVQINVSLSFQPHSINVIQKTCQRGSRESACLNATACFTAVSRSPGPHSNSFGISQNLYQGINKCCKSASRSNYCQKVNFPTLAICLNYRLSPQICGCQRCWMTGSCQRGPCLTTAPTDRLSWQSEFTQDELCATNCLSMSMWASRTSCVKTPPSFKHQDRLNDTCGPFCFHRTQQITSVQSASHCALR